MRSAVALFILMVAGAGPVGSTVDSQPSQPEATASQVLVIGHRGAAGLAPENTTAGVKKALELAVDAVELDVQLSADGELVVYHDYRLSPYNTRGPDGKWVRGNIFIKHTGFAELQTYDVGRLRRLSMYARRYPDQQPFDGERIPALRQVIPLVRSNPSRRRTQLWIEIKTSPNKKAQSSAPEAVVDALAKLLRQTDMTDRARILSFDWRALYHVQQIAPDIPTVYLTRIGGQVQNVRPGQPGPSPWTAPIDVDDYNGSIPQAIRAAGGRYWGPYHRELTAASLKEAHRLGLKVYVWTTDKASDMRRLIEWGIDGIITNRPDVLRTVIESR